MNVCPVCRNVNQPDATMCRFCRTALTPPTRRETVVLEQPRRRRWPWVAGAAALLLVAVIGGLSLLGGGGGAQAATPAITIAVGTGEGASLEFEPTAIEAPANTAVALTFTNQSTLPHNLTFQEGFTAATSPNVAGGAAETINFQTPGPGTYTFVCTIHPGMEGTLTVQ